MTASVTMRAPAQFAVFTISSGNTYFADVNSLIYGVPLVGPDIGDLTKDGCTIDGGVQVSDLLSFGFNPSLLPNLTSALANTELGVADTTINLIGDSITAGVLGNIGTGASYVKASGWPFRLAALMTSSGLVQARSDAQFGDAGTTLHSSTIQQYNPNFSAFTGGFAYTTSLSGPGGLYLGASAASSVTLSLTKATSLDIYYIQNTTYGTFSTNVDAAGTNNISCAGSLSIQKATIALGAEGAHSVVISWVSGQIYLLGFDPSSSTTKSVRLRNFGVGGITTTAAASTASAWSPGTVLSAASGVLQPHATVIMLGTNDMLTGVPLATSQANLQSIIAGAQYAGAGDVILSHVPYISTATVPLPTQMAYRAMIAGLAGNGRVLPLIDPGAQGSWSQLVAAGRASNTNPPHPTAAGYQAIAAQHRNALSGLL